jgi:hypothetical protein
MLRSLIVFLSVTDHGGETFTNQSLSNITVTKEREILVFKYIQLDYKTMQKSEKPKLYAVLIIIIVCIL